MKIEKFNLRLKNDYDKYYPTLKKWWEEWGFKPQTPNLLSTNGLMVNKDGYKCAGWLYLTDSDVGVLAWWISSKDKDRKGCMEYLITELEKLALSLGCKVTMTSASNQFLKNKLEKLGHGEHVDRNFTNYFKKL